MSAVLVAGATSGGPPDYRARFWWVTPDRRLAWLGDDPEAHRLPTPIPGDASVVLADVWWRDPVVLCADGSVVRSAAKTRGQGWIGAGKLTGGDMTKKDEAQAGTPALILGGTERRDGGWRLWGILNTRQIVVAGGDFRGRLIGTPIPAVAAVVACRLAGDYAAEVLLNDGQTLTWTSSGWAATGNFLQKHEAGGLVRIVATRSFALGGGRDVSAGETFEIDSATARRLIASAKATAVAEGPDA